MRRRARTRPRARPPRLLAAVATLAVLVAAGLLVVPAAGSAPAGRGPAAGLTGTGTTSVHLGRVATATPSGVTAAAPGPAAAAVDAEEAAPAGALALVDQTDWVVDGRPFDLRVAVDDDVGDDASLVLDIHAPITSRSQFTATLAGNLLGQRRAEIVVPLADRQPAP